ncbi:hypothetical protein VP01_160g6 [Puccinia sorghi]|uniref:Uncharacterized protein n=1 Tax=Puccinia sorghi TaxID=27349 RepID=A0A0L6VH63_9BASI|nr:hypothetical protein VP01_160g6 [Puccinia sorghi]
MRRPRFVVLNRGVPHTLRSLPEASTVGAIFWGFQFIGINRETLGTTHEVINERWKLKPAEYSMYVSGNGFYGRRFRHSAIVMRSIWDFKINEEVAMEQCSKTWQMAAKRHIHDVENGGYILQSYRGGACLLRWDAPGSRHEHFVVLTWPGKDLTRASMCGCCLILPHCWNLHSCLNCLNPSSLTGVVILSEKKGKSRTLTYSIAMVPLVSSYQYSTPRSRFPSTVMKVYFEHPWLTQRQTALRARVFNLAPRLEGLGGIVNIDNARGRESEEAASGGWWVTNKGEGRLAVDKGKREAEPRMVVCTASAENQATRHPGHLPPGEPRANSRRANTRLLRRKLTLTWGIQGQLT